MTPPKGNAAEGQRREVHEKRYTSLDRIIQRDAEAAGPTESPFFTVTKDPGRAGRGPAISLSERHIAERLMFLASMGLAESAGPKRWRIRRDFDNVLRAMQRSADWQKTLAAHGALISDARLPLNMLDLRDLTTLEGRILVNGEEENSGRNYLLIEGTDACVHYMCYTPEMEMARNAGGLKVDSFIRLRKSFREGWPVLDIDDMGDSDALLRDKRHLREMAQPLVRRGVIPQDDGWDGWLGRYQRALNEVATHLECERVAKETRRDRKRDFSR